MTTTQLHFFNGLYLVILIAVAIATRATPGRIAGALAGGAAFGVVTLGIIALGERAGWWRMMITWRPYFLGLLMLDFILGSFVLLVTWRIARRFGRRGLAAATVALMIIGPPRDYLYMRHFPEWGEYAPGIAPILAISAIYGLLVVVGHGVMRLVAGPAGDDRLAGRPWGRA